MWYNSLRCVTWLPHMHDMTHSGGVIDCYVTHMKPTCHTYGTWRVCMRNVKRIIHMSHMYRACLRDEWVICRIWISATSVLSCPRHDSFIWDTTHSCDIKSYFVGSRKCIHVYKHTYTYTRAHKWCRGQLSTCQHFCARVYECVCVCVHMCMCLYTWMHLQEPTKYLVISHVWVMSQMNESCLLWTSHVVYERVMSHTQKPMKQLLSSKFWRISSESKCVAVRCSALQCVAVRCSALQCIVLCYSGSTLSAVSSVWKYWHSWMSYVTNMN